ncbi:MAG: DUF6502 family protein, partial [Gammaproteobacteria bacterium]|nr:DUF6502 family protein [Gammaproteobacteria bacterium]
EVLRLYNVSVAGKEEKEQKPINRAVRVVNGWLNDDEFSRENQEEPLSLEIQGEHGSFSALVKRYSGDITAGAVLDELVRVGLVEKQGSKVVLKKEGYLPMEGKQEMIEVFGICTTDLLETIDFNLKTDTEQRFQRALIYHNLPKDLVDEFKAFSEEKSNLLLRELNRWLSRRKKRIESTAAEEKIRTGIGVYYFETDETHKSDSYVADLENIHAGKGRGEGT